ncbi:MAG: NAD(P)H-hydrate dehydratase [Bacteroidales bacterium]|nr:NAD(P)H-hydrate dehydratase [Bacteroidales bacterium]
MRNPETTKHDYGHALLIAGAYGRMGCAILAARAALRSGCGLVSVHLPQRCVDPMQAAFPEAMVSIDPSDTRFTTVPDHLERYGAIAVGPGLGTHPDTAQALLHLLEARPAGVPLVLDADALNILATLPKEQFSILNFQLSILTPHAREYERMFGSEDPAEVSKQCNFIIVKKSHRTHVYAPDGRVYVNHTGNAGMATAGSGDVLTGILLGMAAQGGGDPFRMVCKAVEMHGKIGDIAVRKQSESSLIASDMVENLRLVSTDITDC